MALSPERCGRLCVLNNPVEAFPVFMASNQTDELCLFTSKSGRLSPLKSPNSKMSHSPNWLPEVLCASLNIPALFQYIQYLVAMVTSMSVMPSALKSLDIMRVGFSGRFRVNSSPCKEPCVSSVLIIHAGYEPDCCCFSIYIISSNPSRS